MTIGFIGLGRMGSGMARSALRAGHSVIAYNRTRSRAEELAKQGASVANRPADTAEAEVILTMLSDDPAVEETVLGEGGIARAMRPSQIHVSHSTISVALSKRLEAEHRSRGQQYIAAPLSVLCCARVPRRDLTQFEKHSVCTRSIRLNPTRCPD